MYDLVTALIGYSGDNWSTSTIFNICGALTVIFFVMLFYFVFRTIWSLFFK